MKLKYKYIYKDNYDWVELDFIRELRSNPAVIKNVFHSKAITNIEQEEWFSKDYAPNLNWKIYIIIDCEKNIPIGYVNFKIESLIDKRCSFDYFILPELSYIKYDNFILKWCKYYSKVLEENIPIHRLQIYVFEYNKSKVEILYENGFEIDALIRDYIYKDGKYFNVYLMSAIIS
jgi:hypothetical protein